MSLFTQSQALDRHYHEHGFPVKSAAINEAVKFASKGDYIRLKLDGSYSYCDMNGTVVSHSGEAKISTTGMGPCMCLIYAVEVVDRENPSEHVSWVYGLHHLSMAHLKYDKDDKQIKGPYAGIYKDMIDQVHQKAEDPNGLNGLISQMKGFLIPGVSSGDFPKFHGKNTADEIVKQLLTEGPLDNNWSDHYAKYSQGQKVGSFGGAAVSIDIEKNKNLVITTYLYSMDVEEAAAIKYNKKQAKQQSIDIAKFESPRNNPTNLKHRISEIKAKERELLAERRKLEKMIAKISSDNAIWV